MTKEGAIAHTLAVLTGARVLMLYALPIIDVGVAALV